MLIVDTHCHALPHSFEPVEVLLHQMHANGVEKALLVQVRGQFDNRYIMEGVRRFPGRFSAVVMVDTDRPDAPQALERWAHEGAEGVRLDPTVRSPGSDPLAIWRKAAELGLPVSSLGSYQGFTSLEFVQVVREFPNLPIIVEHLGAIGWDDAPPYPKFRQILALAQYPNVYVKIHGLGEICPRPSPFPQPMRFPDIPPFMQMAHDAFGPSHLMWGSDFPPVAGREGYRNALRWTLEHLAARSEDDQAWVFGKTALSLFKFAER